MSDAAERPDRPQNPESPHHVVRGPVSRDRSAERGERPRSGPGAARAVDADAWATACAEDLAAEKDRRRARYGPGPGSAAEELRRLLDAVADKLADLPGAAAPLLGMAAQGAAQQMVRQVVQQAKAAVEPVIERNPDLFDHLAAAGSELLAAYRSAMAGQEQRWTRGSTMDRAGGRRADAGAGSARDKEDRPGGRRADAGAGSARDKEDRPEVQPGEERGDHSGRRGHDGPMQRPDRPDEGPEPGEHIDVD